MLCEFQVESGDLFLQPGDFTFAFHNSDFGILLFRLIAWINGFLVNDILSLIRVITQAVNPVFQFPALVANFSSLMPKEKNVGATSVLDDRVAA